MIISHAIISEGYMFVSKENKTIELIYTTRYAKVTQFLFLKKKMQCSQTFIHVLL